MFPQALFTRLLLPEPGNHLIHMTSTGMQNLSAERDAGEKHILRYLFACFRRAKEEVGQTPISYPSCLLAWTEGARDQLFSLFF